MLGTTARRAPWSAAGNPAALFIALFALTLVLRLCHLHILWADEDYHLAAGIQTLQGKLLYRDIWYDKPPLAAWLYAAIGAYPGWSLRLFDAFYILAICAALYRFARELWGPSEASLAAALAAFCLNFDAPPAIIPLAPDLFMLLPHIAAVYCAWKRRPFTAGLLAGVAFLFHTKGLFVLAICAFLARTSLPTLLLGFLIPNAAALAVLAAGGALPDYFRQVWQWGVAYTNSSPDVDPMAGALRRTADWFGFHGALVLGAAAFWWRNSSGADDRFSSSASQPRTWFAAWLIVSVLGVALGGRFFPRYFFLLLPPTALLSARSLKGKPLLFFAAGLLLIPFIRFGPRYLTFAQDLLVHREHRGSDLLIYRDSRAVSAVLDARKRPGDTLFVWGYNPSIYVYTRLPAAARYWDSQPLTGVPADRHLDKTRFIPPIVPEWAAHNRSELITSTPTFIVDSLSRLNPNLAIDAYPELRAWMADYRLIARTPLSLIYEK
ncbi:MAG TPA: glycosyltransferase family 39 protein [Bryobacteraceae bacterium]|nr:glycosyltransferase family 39 protein [Bryobacteraceae bacterium]